MRASPFLSRLAAFAMALLFQVVNSTTGVAQYPVNDAIYDGSCFYPKPFQHFNLTSYLGTWYQVAGTPFGPTSGARCVTADYSLNENRTVKVTNSARVGDQKINITGVASPVDGLYGLAGVFKVNFPDSSPTPCPGPNYIVQEYFKNHAIVQTQNWTTLYILSRERNPMAADINDWTERAIALGSNASTIVQFNQTDC